MKSIIPALGLIVAFTTDCPADVSLVGGIQPAKSIPFKTGLGLIEALDGSKALTCSKVSVIREESTFEIDLPGILANPAEDWPLADGDIVSMAEHVLPCLNESDSAAFLSLFREHRLIRYGKLSKPADWQQRVDRLPSHVRTRPRKELIPADATSTAEAGFARASRRPGGGIRHKK